MDLHGGAVTSVDQGSAGWFNELAADASTGDHLARERLAGYVQPMIQRYCRTRIGRGAGGHDTADDVAQEACLGIFAALPRYYGKNHPFNSFAYRIAANKVADHYRKLSANRATTMEDPPERSDSAPTPEDTAIGRELSGRVQLLLSLLDDREREIVSLRIVVGLSAAETAREVGSTSGAIRVTQHRALVKLRTALAESRARVPLAA